MKRLTTEEYAARIDRLSADPEYRRQRSATLSAYANMRKARSLRRARYWYSQHERYGKRQRRRFSAIAQAAGWEQD